MSPGPVADDDARARIARDVDTTMVVVAGAGTGKTTALVSRIIELVRGGASTMRAIAAITFTEAAAAELRQRVRDALAEAAAAEPDNEDLETALQEADEAVICTLHAFAQRLLTEQSVAAGLPPGFEVLDATAEVADFETRWARFADSLLDDTDAEPALVRGFTLGLQPRDLERVAWGLQTHWDRLEDGALIARPTGTGTGTGWPQVDPVEVTDALRRALAMAPWCTASDDRLLNHILDVIDDALTQLTAVAGDEHGTLHVLMHLRPLRFTNGRQENWGGGDRISEVRAACRAAEDARVELLDRVRGAVLDDLVPRLAGFVLGAAEERRLEGTVTFHDLLVLARRLLRGGGEPVAALRDRYRRLLIDEFQDTDPIQVELAARLTMAIDGDGYEPGALFVVGDPKQSIYRFRRADIELFNRVAGDIGEPLVLSTNFRSVPGVLDFVNVVFAELFAAGGPGQAAHEELVGSCEALPATVPDPEAPGGPAVAEQLRFDGIDTGPPSPAAARRGAKGAPGSRAAGPNATPGPPAVSLLGSMLGGSVADVRRQAAEEAAAALQAIVGRWPVRAPDGELRAVRWSDIAVLIPTRSSLASLEEAFEDAAVPYRLEGAAMVWGSEQVRDVLTVLHAADDPVDTVAVLAALRSPGLGCGDDDLVTWHQAGGTWDPRARAPQGLADHPVATAMAVLESLHRQRWWSDPSTMAARAITDLRAFELAADRRRPRDHWHRLRWLVDQARLFDDSGGGTLRAFLRWADLQADGEAYGSGVGPPDPDDDAVRVMTVHGAKGLEFPVVVLAGLERDDSSVPQQDAVLWTEDGTPEVSAGRFFRTAGYDGAVEHHQQLDALERHRLLYVAMTRARDHLVLCVHHKGRHDGPDASLAASLLDIASRNPLMWRRLGPTKIGGDDRDGEVADEAGDGLGPDQWRTALTDWQGERAALLARLRRRPTVTATAVAELASYLGTTSPASIAPSAPDPGWPGSTEAPWRSADEALHMGRAVHTSLAAIDLATGEDPSGRSAAEVARGRAVAHGVGVHGDTVVSMVEAALASAVVRAAASTRYWKEMYVAAPLHDAGDGQGSADRSGPDRPDRPDGLLEGFVDLLFEEGDDLVVVDYKTDRIGPHEMAEVARRYRLQLATYAVAVEAATGRRVSRCVLLFVGDGVAIEHALDGEALDAARAEVVSVSLMALG